MGAEGVESVRPACTIEEPELVKEALADNFSKWFGKGTRRGKWFINKQIWMKDEGALLRKKIAAGALDPTTLQIQQHYKKFTGQNSFHTIVGNRVLSKIRSLFGSVQFRNSLHRIGVVAKRGHPPILI